MSEDGLAGWERGSFTAAGITHETYRRGTGPGVVVVHEIPGITPAVTRFANEVVDAGFTVVMPSLVGTPGKEVSPAYLGASSARVCIAREFTTWALGMTSPVIAWLRALGRSLHLDVGGAGIGAVGMCFSGGFALGMMVDDHLLAPVLSQPSLPLGFGRKRRAGLHLSPQDRLAVKARADAGVCVMAARFTDDPLVPKRRFDAMKKLLGDNFIGIEIDSSKGNPYGIDHGAHSVLTEHLVDEPGHPTRDALDRVLDFLADRLLPAAG